MALRLKKGQRGFRSTDEYVLDMDALEAGDKVAMVHTSRMGGPSATMYTVVRRTKTQIIAEGPTWQKEFRFRAEDGSPVGDSHYSVLMAPFDPEVLDALEAMHMAEHHRALGKILARKTNNHDERMDMLAAQSGLAARTQNDLLDIRKAVTEWHAQKDLADA